MSWLLICVIVKAVFHRHHGTYKIVLLHYSCAFVCNVHLEAYWLPNVVSRAEKN